MSARVRADIVAVGEDGTLVVENQFGKADWDHWGRLEAYARLKEADAAVLVAENFEELMIVTCNLRNEDSAISWYPHPSTGKCTQRTILSSYCASSQ